MIDAWLYVKVHPSAGKDVLVNTGPRRYEAWLKAKPIEGRANESVTALIARTLAVPASRVRLVKGHSGRHKVFQVVT